MSAGLTDLAAVFANGYTDDDINSVLDDIRRRTGVFLVCVWERFENGYFTGDSQLFLFEGNQLCALTGDLWAWLLDGEAQVPGGPGPRSSWKGSLAGFDPGDCESDGRHNLARRRVD